MPKSSRVVHSDRKLTDFFQKKAKTGPRPGQPIYDVSSSSERQSIISISSDDIVITSNPIHIARVQSGALGAGSHCRGNTLSKVQPTASSSRLSKTPTIAISSSPSRVLKSSANDTSITSGPNLQRSPIVSVPKKNAKKRKEQPICIISSEESDDPVLPSIHVRLFSKNSEAKNSSPQRLAPDESPSVSSVAPLTPRQNLLDHLKYSDTLPAAPFLKPVVQQMKTNIPATPTHSRSSPSNCVRRESVSSGRVQTFAPGFVTGGDGDFQIAVSAQCLGKQTSPTAQYTHPFAVDDARFMDDDKMHMDVGLVMPNANSASHGDGENGANEDGRKENDDAGSVLIQSGSLLETQEVLPSSQQGEMELLIDEDHSSIDEDHLNIVEDHINVGETNTSEHPHHPSTPTPSPRKARTDSIIARIKAKAEADAAAQVQDDLRRSSLGQIYSDESDLSSLSSLSTDEDEDEGGLEFELSTFRTGSLVKTSENLPSVTSPGPGTRRSTRHLDLPAPNYAKKLELFRELPSTPSNNDVHHPGPKTKIRAKLLDACPLDSLLKDQEREGARKARVETKRKRDVSGASGSDSMLDFYSGPFKTPRRGGHGERQAETESPDSDLSSSQDSNAFQEIMMGTADREELLGKEAADAVTKILNTDRTRKKVIQRKDAGFSFWCDKKERVIEDEIPRLVTSDQSHPFLTALNDAISRDDFSMASLLVDSGAFTTIPLSDQPVDWLFSAAMSVTNFDISLSAYRALLVLHREVSSTEVMSRAQLSSRRLLAGLFKLGVNTHIAQLLGADEEDVTSIKAMSQQLKGERLYRFCTMVAALGRSQIVDPTAIPSVVSALLLLSLDSSATPELQQDAVSAIEALLSNANVTPIVELDTCRFVFRITKHLAFSPDLQGRILSLLPGCSPSSGRVRRWTAWAMLGGDLQSIRACVDVPPIELMLGLFSKSSPGDVKLEVTSNTDYEELGAIVNILSVAMTDVDTYVRCTNGSAMVKNLYEALEQMNGKIVDTRAAHIDRTRTKEAINRLHKRLLYQHHATLETLRRKTGNMDQFLVRRPKSSSRKSPNKSS